MFSIAASAAQQAAMYQPKPLPKKRPSGTKSVSKTKPANDSKPARRSSIGTTTPKKTSWAETPAIPGVRPILKRQDTTKTVTVSEEENSRSSDEPSPSVRFGFLDIKEHAIELGDSPYCEGAPLAISNTLVRSEKVPIDEYEEDRCDRRERKELSLSSTARTQILLSMGYSVEDVADAALRTQKARLERAASLQSRKWDSFHAIAEQMNRKVKKLVSGTSTEQQTVLPPTA